MTKTPTTTSRLTAEFEYSLTVEHFLTLEDAIIITFNRTDWPSFNNYTEDEKLFRDTLNRATKRYIPSFRIPEIKPNFATEAAVLADRHYQLRGLLARPSAIQV